MTRALLLSTSLAMSMFLAGCGKEEEIAESPKEWKAYVPPVASGSLTGTGTLIPDTGTGSVKN